jgi:hypothetical protein
MLRKISLAMVLMSAAGVASATNAGSGSCVQVLWFTVCPPAQSPTVNAPEIDPASAMTGLTLLFGGLTVLRGRRKNSKR